MTGPHIIARGSTKWECSCGGQFVTRREANEHAASNIGDVPELAAAWLRSRPQFCATCGGWLAAGLPCVECIADGWYAEAVANYDHEEDE